MTIDKSSQLFFDNMYANSHDPWSFQSNSYELERFHTIIANLSEKTYVHTFEPGCSIGVLTQMLGKISSQVTAFDISVQAIKYARERCSTLTNVVFSHDTLLNKVPDPTTDLIVLCEVGYYFQKAELTDILARLIHNSSSRLSILTAHWLGYSPDHVLSGDEVHEVILRNDDLLLVNSARYEKFRLDKLVKKQL